MVLAEIIYDEDQASVTFLSRFMKKHTAALESWSHISFAREEAVSGLIPLLQRRVLDLFIQRFDSWQMGILRRIMPDERRSLLSDLRLFRDEFDILRDLYQQGFETVCKTLRYPVAAQNTVKRGRPDAFGSDFPSVLTRENSPRDIAAFEGISNFDKLWYIGQVPGWDRWAGFLDNKTRNAIGHAAARHDLRTGLVVSDTVPDGVPCCCGCLWGIRRALHVPSGLASDSSCLIARLHRPP
jgi:hypothetical protein